MPLHDYYVPSQPVSCPVCRTSLREWQGYDGPCGLFVFQEGVSSAVDHRVDDHCRLAETNLASLLLPEEFLVSSHDCGCPFPTVLRCLSTEGIWRSTMLYTGTPDDLQLQGAERREHWQKRRRWLAGRTG